MMQKEQVYLLSSKEFRHHWKDIREALHRIPQYAEQWTDEEVFEAAVKGALQFWALSNGEIQCILMTEIRSSQLGKTLRFLGATGQKFNDFEPTLEGVFDRVGVQLGCDRIEVVATREGWERKLKPMGFRRSHSILIRPVNRTKEH